MNIHQQILALQWEQLRHDELYHKEIVLLTVADRMKHMTLHFAKYVGVIAEAVETRDENRVNRTLIDVFIIALASANALNLDLGREVAGPKNGDLTELGQEFAARTERLSTDNGWLISRLAQHSGRLAKACESLDHLESFPYRETMREHIMGIFKLVVAEAVLRKLDLIESTRGRLRAVEIRNMFDEHYRGAK